MKIYKNKFLKELKENKKLFTFILVLFIFVLFYTPTYLISPKIDKIPYSTIVYDTNNIRIGEVIKDNRYRHESIIYDEIPEFTKRVVITLEDKTFYKNNGIDYKAIIRAFINNINQGKIIEGASTISTQVIRNNYWLNEERTLFKKIKEFYLSLALNKSYTKEEILTNYLSTIYFGYLNYGIKSASYYYFGKELNSLTKAEQIAIISLPKNPKKYDPYKNKQEFKNRFKQINVLLLQNHIISNEEYDSIINEKIELNENHENKLPYVIDYLKNLKKENSQINTTIDYNLTNKINDIAKNSILPLMWKNVKDYAIIIIDKNTKELKVMIGGINYYSTNGQVSMITSPRQAGSTVKPFTYVLAFRDLGFTPETTITDLPTQFLTDLGYSYNPKNYSLDYKGEVSISEALSQSINIPAIKIVEKVGVKKLLDFLKDLGITSLTKDESYYGLALTLGVGEINLFELTRAYSLFAYDGELCDIKIVKGNSHPDFISGSLTQNKFTKLNIKDSEISSEGQYSCRQLVDKKYTDMINEILTNRYNKLNSFPINGNLDFPDKNVFLKTGTSRNFKDNWTIGYTSNYIIGVWAGNKDGSEMKGVSGASGAGEIFKNVIDYLEKDTNKIDIKKTEKISENYLEIISPLNNSKYKIDPFKSKDLQKIKLDFSTNLVYDSYKWFVNDKEIKSNFLELEKGQKEIKIVLYNEIGEIVLDNKVFVSIE